MKTFVKFEGAWLILDIVRIGNKLNVKVVDVMPDRREAQRAILSWAREEAVVDSEAKEICKPNPLIKRLERKAK